MTELVDDNQYLTRRDLLVGGAALILAGNRLLRPGLAMASAKGIEKDNPKEIIDLLKDGKWAVPGVTRENDGLRVARIDYSIIGEDGNYIENSPVNLFGTYLKVDGNFEITAEIKDFQGEAALTLYGKPPLTFDEKRYETPSVRDALQGDSFWVGVMNVPAQDYGNGHNFQVRLTNDAHVLIRRHNGQIDLTLNGKHVGMVAEHDTFESGEVWFGLDSTGDKNGWLLADLSARPLNGGHLEAIDSTYIEVQKNPNALNVLAQKKRPGFQIGTALASAPLVSDRRYAELALNGDYGVFTPENAMKPQFLQPERGVFTFQEADALLSLAAAHGLKAHGHTLVFACALPKWIHELDPRKKPADVEAAMLEHIKAVASHFKGRVVDWDVINEPLGPNYFNKGDGPILRDHIWHQAMGDSYIEKALRAAHGADPTAKLRINEWGLETSDARWEAMFALVTKLKKSGVPIHGVGIQGHVDDPNRDRIYPDKLKHILDDLNSIGLEGHVSEMDVARNADSAADKVNQAKQFADVLKLCITQPNCHSFTMWGITELYGAGTDISNGRLETYSGLPWDAHEKPLPAVAAMQKVLR